MYTQSLNKRLQKNIIKLKTGCWHWNGAHSGNSPVIGNEHGSRNVKNILYKMKNPNSEIMGYIKFSCGNNRCINPDHLMNREEFFNSFIYKNTTTGCWEWQGETKEGYGYFFINKIDKAVHRIMYEKYKGKIPHKKNVCHSCDNTICCNPEHLWLGSQADNVRDMIIKKRDHKSFGINHHRAKVTEKDVYEIRKKYNEGMKMKSIHRLLNIPYRTIQHICTNNTWKHLL